MKKYILFLCLAGFFLISCATMKSRFNETKKIDTIAAYEAFLSKYPDNPFADEAKKRIEEIYYENAKEQNTIASYETFLSKYPDSPFTAEAKKRIEMIYYENAKEQNTIAGYVTFLSEYPDSPFADEVKKRIEMIYYENAKEQNTIAAYEGFLKKYPDGPFSDEAKKRIDEHIPELIQQLQSTNHTFQLNALIALSKEGHKAINAIDSIDKFVSNKGDTLLNKIASATKYIIDPEGKYMGKSGALMALLGLDDKAILEGLIIMASMDDREINSIALESIGWNITSTLSKTDFSDSWIPITLNIKWDPEVENSIDILFKYLNHENTFIRRSAAMALASIGLYPDRCPSLSKVKNFLTKSGASKDNDAIFRGFAKVILGYKIDDDMQTALNLLKEQHQRFHSY